MKSFYKAAFIFTIVAALAFFFVSCSNGGGTETGNGIADPDIEVKDSIVIRDSVIIRDSIVIRDSVITKDSVNILDSVNVRDSVVIRDSIVDKDSSQAGASSFTGYVQKGPFLDGSTVYIFELDNEELMQTGKVFHGKTGDNGQFKISNIKIQSQFAILEATGYFVNEITGKESSGQITMRAVADVTESENININFLTQLEYDRVMYLVQNGKLALADAKKQARKEILATFFGVESSTAFEDMNIFGNKDEDAMLLAISVLALDNNSDAKFSQVMSKFSEDIETDGVFGDSALRAKIADNAAFFINTPAVRKNVENLKGGEVPAFEKYIRKYWTNEFGLGKCDELGKGTVKQNGNPYSGYRTTRFICDGENWEPYYFNEDCNYGTFTDERDGYTYRTTTIGDQTWLAENLQYKGNGYNCYNDNEMYCKKYGAYYNYAQIECPAGWHLPDTTEWAKLFEAVGGEAVASKALRSRGGWDRNIDVNENIVDDQDEFCFSALPAGVFGIGAEGVLAYFYTSSMIERDGVVLGAWNRVINNTDNIGKSNMYNTTSVAVRCVMDSE